MHRWLYILIGGFGVGVGIRSAASLGIFQDVTVNSGPAVAGFFFLLGFAILVYLYVRELPLRFIGIAVFFFAVGLGVLRFEFAERTQGELALDMRIGTEIVVEGVVVDEPDERERHTKYTVQAERIAGETTTSLSGKSNILITLDRYPSFSYGDRVVVSGTLDRPEDFESDTGRIFHYEKWLEKDDIFYMMFYPKVEKIGEGEGNVIVETLFAIKHAFLKNIQAVIPEPAAALAGGLIVGAKQSLGEDLLSDFRIAGVIHIVVLSGYNMTIVAEFIGRIFSFLGIRLQAILGIGAIALFTILTGGGATAVRAGIMASLVLIARMVNHPYVIMRALLVTGFFMVLYNPHILVFDPSFQLSFIATLGLVYLAPKIEERLHFVPTKWQFREFATATIATQIFVLPLLLWMTGELSLVSLPANLLILGVVPLTMLLGFLTGMVGFVSAILSLPFAFMTYALLSFQLYVVEIFASMPFASVLVPAFPFFVVVLVYGIYSFVIYKIETPVVR